MLHFIIGTCFVLGLLLAGSDGAYFPYLNLVGLAVFSLVPALSRRINYDD